MKFDDTIAAISTPPGTGAIAIVRMSGPAALDIGKRIFRPGAGCDAVELSSHSARHGYVIDPDSAEMIDEVVMIAYRAPRTYTGEDLIEVSCHGGPVVTSEILALCLRLGARLAQAGEIPKRCFLFGRRAQPAEFAKAAFLCGRLDLTQAEAVLDLIQAKTGRQGRIALSALSGQLG